MLDREIGLTGKDPKKSAKSPAEGVARVEREGTIDQPDHRTDILAEIRQHEGGNGEDARVVLRHLGCLPSEIAGHISGHLRLFSPAVDDELHVAGRRPGECWPVTRIDRDRPFEQSQSLEDPLLSYGKVDSNGAQV